MPLPTPYLKVIEKALLEAIERLSKPDANAGQKALLIEARRLRAAIGTWHAIPPEPALQAEMLARVKSLTAEVGASLVPPPPDDPRAAFGSAPDPTGRPRSSPPASPGLWSGRFAGSSVVPPPPPLPPEDDEDTSTGPLSGSPSGYARHDAETTIGGGVVRVRLESVAWRPFRHLRGVSMKPVSWSEAQELYSALLRLDAGAEIPRRRHAGAEDLIVLEGSLRVGDAEIRAGEAMHAEAGSLHDAIRSESGAMLFVVGSTLDELLC